MIMYASFFWHYKHAGMGVAMGIFYNIMVIHAQMNLCQCTSTYSPPKYASISFWLCVRAEDQTDYNECTIIHLSHCVFMPISMNICALGTDSGGVRTGNVKVEVVPWEQRQLYMSLFLS